MAPSKKQTNKSNFQLADGHKISFQSGIAAQGSIDAFGKVVDPPVPGLAAGQQMALVYGIRENGTCIRLPSPQHIALPAPNGAADEYGWNPKEFVVWKKLSRSMPTTHLQVRNLSLDEVLKPALAVAPTSPQPTVDDVLHQWLSRSSAGQPIPNEDQLQVAWRDYGSGGAYTLQIQQNLANRLNHAFFGSNYILPTDLPATLTVGQLKLKLHRTA
jgi:hypothetical protein